MKRLLFLLALSCEVDTGADQRPEDQKVDPKCWYTKDLQARRDCQKLSVTAPDAGTPD